jgi:hypothetical protein
VTAILTGADRSTAGLGRARTASSAASASRITSPQRSARGSRPSQMAQVLLDAKSADPVPLLPIAIPKICAGPVATEEFVLDVER